MAAGLAAGAVGIMAARVPIATRQLWAEDGSIFLQDALDMGPVRPVAHSFAGYFQFVSRAIGGVASMFPIRWAATVTWVLVALVVAWCVATIFVDSSCWLRSLWSRSALALGLVLLPTAGNEALGSSANIQFMLLFTAIVVLMQVEPRSWRATGSGCALVLAAGWTSALALVLAPLVLFRLLSQRRIDPVTVAWALGVTVQWAAIVLTKAGRTTPSAWSQFPTAVEHALGGPVIVATALVVIGAGLLLAVGWQRRVAILLVPAVGLSLLAVAAARSAGILTARYWMVPAWCVIWAVLVSVDVIAGRLSENVGRLMPVAACLVLAGISLAGWTPIPARTDGPSWTTSLDQAAAGCGTADRVRVLTMPEYLGVPFSLWVDCDRMR